MEMYCVRLKEDHKITSIDIQEKIEQLELKTPEERFPDVHPSESAYEAYFWGTKDECLDYIANRDDDIRDLFAWQKV
jgi:hypothetical protein